MIWLIRSLFLVFALTFAAPVWAGDHEGVAVDATQNRAHPPEGSLKKELDKIGIKPPTALAIKLSKEKQYTESVWFKGGTYYEEGSIHLSSPFDMPALSLAYSRCKTVNESMPELMNAWERGERDIPLSKLLPAFACDNVGKPGRENANCWNTSLNFHGKAKGVCFTPPGEMQKILEGNEFLPVGKGDQLLPGDVVVFYDGEPGAPTLKHSAVFIGGNVFFHKGSANDKDPYTFEKFEDLTQYYRKTSDDLQVRVYRKNKADNLSVRQ